MRRLATVLLLTLAVAACTDNGDRDAKREAVERYVHDAQSVLQRDEPGFRLANEAYAAYARGKLEPEQTAARMRAAQRTIEDARDGIAVLDRAEPAQPLHDTLMTYLELNRRLAAETTLLAAYVPAAKRALAPIAGINRRLNERLSGSRDSRAQAHALRRFGDALGGVRHRLRELDAPPVLRPAHRDQITRLAATQRLARRLRQALAERDTKRVAVLLKAFRETSRGGEDVNRLERQARARYTRRVEQLGDAYRDVRRETLRLQRELS